tara:strand:+ start:575 stop:793 length:219 start_codon:yes stop_codon:yes gene_type:complete
MMASMIFMRAKTSLKLSSAALVVTVVVVVVAVLRLKTLMIGKTLLHPLRDFAVSRARPLLLTEVTAAPQALV